MKDNKKEKIVFGVAIALIVIVAVSLVISNNATDLKRIATSKNTELTEAELKYKVDSAMVQYKKEFETKKDSTKRANHIFNWEYNEKEDPMTSKKDFFATLPSTNTIEFEFPYNGGSKFYLNVRKKGQIDIFLNSDKCQFSTRKSIKVRFDDEKPMTFSFNEPSDGSSNIIFINSEKLFLEKLKKSKKLLIEAEFYNEGLRIIEFYSEGLKWNH